MSLHVDVCVKTLFGQQPMKPAQRFVDHGGALQRFEGMKLPDVGDPRVRQQIVDQP